MSIPSSLEAYFEILLNGILKDDLCLLLGHWQLWTRSGPSDGPASGALDTVHGNLVFLAISFGAHFLH